jgi:lipoprotein NlpD
MLGIRRRLSASLLAVLAVAGCGGRQAVAPVSTARGAAPMPPDAIYVIRKGDTLYSIAWRCDLDYPTLAAWNGIGEPYRIYPGQRLRLTPPPAATVRTRASEARPPPVAASPAPSASPSPKPLAPDGRNDVRLDGEGGLAWTWPVKGKVVRTFSASDPGKKGLDIAGRAGQPIGAAAPGKVVYSGSGLIGYGNLIIVKHNDRYLSAYAHGARLLVKEGEWVKAGQPIAEMGRTGTDGVILHFEIRRQGKPVDPLRYLPPRP